MEYTYHPLVIDDYDEIYALWNSVPGMGLSGADSRGNIDQFLSRNPNQSFICKAAGHIVGTILCGNDGRRAYIYHTAVAPEHRRQGIASGLLRLAMSAQRECGMQKCHLFIINENELGKVFWRAAGFCDRQDVGIMSSDLVTYRQIE